jgi:hypothetical protein
MRSFANATPWYCTCRISEHLYLTETLCLLAEEDRWGFKANKPSFLLPMHPQGYPPEILQKYNYPSPLWAFHRRLESHFSTSTLLTFRPDPPVTSPRVLATFIHPHRLCQTYSAKWPTHQLMEQPTTISNETIPPALLHSMYVDISIYLYIIHKHMTE